MLDMYVTQSCVLQTYTHANREHQPHLTPKKRKNALVSRRHRRPHHHRVLIDTNMPILQHGRKMAQHRLSIRHRHAVPAKLHPAQQAVVKHPAVDAAAASVEPILGRVGRRRRRRRRRGHVVQPASAERHGDLG